MTNARSLLDEDVFILHAKRSGTTTCLSGRWFRLDARAQTMLADLIELNGIYSDFPEIPVQIMTEQAGRIAPLPTTDGGL